MGRPLGSALALTLLLGACGRHAQAVSAACIGRGDGATIRAALRAAPGRAVLDDGTPLSDCVARAVSDTDLQNVGGSFTRAGADLADRAPSDARAPCGSAISSARWSAGREHRGIPGRAREPHALLPLRTAIAGAQRAARQGAARRAARG